MSFQFDSSKIPLSGFLPGRSLPHRCHLCLPRGGKGPALPLPAPATSPAALMAVLSTSHFLCMCVPVAACHHSLVSGTLCHLLQTLENRTGREKVRLAWWLSAGPSLASHCWGSVGISMPCCLCQGLYEDQSPSFSACCMSGSEGVSRKAPI